MIADSVAFLVARGQARPLRRRALLRRLRATTRDYALECLRAAADAGAERARPVRHERRVAAGPGRARRRATSSRGARRPRASRHPLPQRRRVRASRTRSSRSRPARRQVQGTMNGVGERTGNANLVSIIAGLQLKLGHEVVAPEQLAHLTEIAHFVDELLNRAPDPQPAVRRARTRSPTRAACTSPGVRADRATFEHVDPALVGNRRELADLRAGRPRGTVAEKAEAAGPRGRRRRRRADHRARQGRSSTPATSSRPPTARSSCCCARRPASTSRCSARVVARDRRAARRRQGRDRGDDQDLGRRRALRAHRRGQRPGQRARRRAARGDHRDPPAPARHRARQLQGPHPRRDEGHRRGHARADRRLRRPRRVGLDRRARERHRRLVAGARRLARVRRCSRAAAAAARARRGRRALG